MHTIYYNIQSVEDLHLLNKEIEEDDLKYNEFVSFIDICIGHFKRNLILSPLTHLRY